MKNFNLRNILLAVIAINLSILTINQIELVPSAQANEKQAVDFQIQDRTPKVQRWGIGIYDNYAYYMNAVDGSVELGKLKIPLEEFEDYSKEVREKEKNNNR